MKTQAVTNLDFEIFRRLLRGFLPPNSSFEVVDERGAVIHVDGEISDSMTREAMQLLDNVANQPNPSGPSFEFLPTGSDQVLLVAGLSMAGKPQLSGALIVLAPEPFPRARRHGSQDARGGRLQPLQ